MYNVCTDKISSNQTFSSGNIKLHFQSRHKTLHTTFVKLKEQNATEDMLAGVVARARGKTGTSLVGGRIIKLVKQASTDVSATIPTSAGDVPVPKKTLQAVRLGLYSCSMESLALHIGSLLTQGLVSICNGRMLYLSKDPIDSFMIPTYRAVCSLYRTAASSAETGSVTPDGWNGALRPYVLGIAWHFMDDARSLNTFRISTLHTGAASKRSERRKAIVDAVMKESTTVASDS